MVDKLTKGVRDKLLDKLMTFEIGWFDEEESTSAANCARLAIEGNLVRSLFGNRMSLLVQAIFGSIFSYAIGLVLSWRLTLVVIAVQPLVIVSHYSKSVLMKSMTGKAQKARREGSQLASEAVINHRTITAFSSQKRMLGIVKKTLRGTKERSARHSWLSGVGLFLCSIFQHWLCGPVNEFLCLRCEKIITSHSETLLAIFRGNVKEIPISSHPSSSRVHS